MPEIQDVYASLDELKLHMTEGVDFVVELIDRGSDVTVLSPHGGFIEAGTSALACAIADTDFNFYDFRGLLEDDPFQLHVTSTKFEDQVLSSLLYRSTIAISVHGMGKTDIWAIWLGGLNRDLKVSIGLSLLANGFIVNFTPPRYKGEHEKNIVNYPQNAGVQLELPDTLVDALFEDKVRFSIESEPRLTELGNRFITAVRRGVLMMQPGKLLPKPD